MAATMWFRHMHVSQCAVSWGFLRRYSSVKSRNSITMGKLKGSRLPQGGKKATAPLTFSQMCAMRRDEAERSLLIQIPSRRDLSSVYHLINKCGPIKQTFYFSHTRDYALVEVESKTVVRRVLSTASHFTNIEKIPVESRVLYLMSSEPLAKSRIPLTVHYDTHTPLQISDLYSAKSLTEQLQILYQGEYLTELGCRLRFFVCSNLEDMMSGLFPQCTVQPFGSTVNGFGKHNCDLDMTLNLLHSDHETGRNPRLKFMTKRRSENERGFTQTSLHTIADIVQQFVPLCTNVQRILNARVPIIKFKNEACNIECDMSFSHMIGVKMSELLYLYSQVDSRVRPLVFAIRRWARVCELTKDHPGPWLSNFMLTILTVFFLQSRPQPVLPTLNTLRQLAGPEDRCVIEDVDCTYTSDFSKLPVTANTEDLGLLLMEFFSFYASFDFTKNAVSLTKGAAIPKADYSPMCIENPLDTTHNIARNVNASELERVKKCFETALWTLETSGTKANEPWGLTSILTPNGNNNRTKVHVRVGELFDEGQGDGKNGPIGNLDTSDSQRSSDSSSQPEGILHSDMSQGASSVGGSVEVKTKLR